MIKKPFVVFVLTIVIIFIAKLATPIAIMSFNFAIEKYKETKQETEKERFFAKENMLKTEILPYSKQITNKEGKISQIFVNDYTKNVSSKDITPAIKQIGDNKNPAYSNNIDQYIVLDNRILFIVQNFFNNSDTIFFTEIYEYATKTKVLKNLGWFEGRYDGAKYKLLKNNLLLLYGGTKITEGESESGHEFKDIVLIYLK